MDGFDWHDGERTLHFGRGRAAEAVDLAGGPGYTLLTTDRGRDTLPGVADAAGAVHTVPSGRVDEIAADLLGTGAERIVALGGGRVIDVAKAVCAAHRREHPGAHVVAIPTTLSGAEMTWVHRHAAGVPADTPRARPRVVITDSAVAASQPEEELAASALNAMGHAVEAPITTRANPVATLAAREAAKLIAGGYTFEEADRDALALGAMLGGYAIDSAWYGLHHVMSQTLVRLAGAGHGPANAVLLRHTTAALGKRFPKAHAELGVALGGDPDEVLAAICARTGATRLRDLGVTEEQLAECADAAAERAELDLTPPRADRDELLAIYTDAL